MYLRFKRQGSGVDDCGGGRDAGGGSKMRRADEFESSGGPMKIERL